MLKILNELFTWIFPRSIASTSIKNETTDSILRFYNTGSYEGIIFLSPYQEKIISSCVTANKFDNDNHGAILLSALLSRWLQNFEENRIILVPIPLSSKRQRERGYNQVERILEPLKDQYQILKLLKKISDTKPQTTLNRQERLQNLAGTIITKDVPKTEGLIYIIVDDVTTTGTTLKTGRNALEPQIGKDSRIILVAITH